MRLFGSCTFRGLGHDEEEICRASTTGKWFCSRLGTPKFEDGEWRFNVRMEHVPIDLTLFWTGHSARHFLPQVSATIGRAKPDRGCLGRWSVCRVGANAYLHTSRLIIERIQQQSLKPFHGEGTPFDES